MRHRPVKSTATIFTDSEFSQHHIKNNILAVNYIQGQRKRKRTPDLPFSKDHILPIVRTIIWQSRWLFEHGCKLQIHWIPRCSTFATRIADHVAGLWRREDAVYSQGNLARNRRDGILDKLHQDVSDVVRSRSTPPPTDHFASGRPDKKRRLKKYLPAEARNLLTISTPALHYSRTNDTGYGEALPQVNPSVQPSNFIPTTAGPAPLTDNLASGWKHRVENSRWKQRPRQEAHEADKYWDEPPDLFPIMKGPPSEVGWIWYPFGFPLAPVASTTEAPRSGDQRPSTQPEIPTFNEFPAGFTRAFGTFPRPHSPARGLCWEIADEDEIWAEGDWAVRL